MNSDALKELQDEVDPLINNALNLAYGSCAIELQVGAVNSLVDGIVLVDEHHKAAIDQANEVVANRLFMGARLAYSAYRYLWMWIHVKQDDTDDAWDALIDAQSALECLLRLKANKTYQDLLDRMLEAERIVFPPQTYTSPSIQFRTADCSICGGTYGECCHVAGRLYMGKLCNMVVRDIHTLNHQAIVEVPEDKGCRCTAFQRGEDMVDRLTMRVKGKAARSDEGHHKMEFICMRASQPMQLVKAVGVDSTIDTTSSEEAGQKTDSLELSSVLDPTERKLER